MRNGNGCSVTEQASNKIKINFIYCCLIANFSLKRLKVVKIEKASRPSSDFIKNPDWRHSLSVYHGKYRHNKPKVDISLDDRLFSDAKSRNHCATCPQEAVKIITYANSVIERFCQSCFDKRIDLDKMQVRRQVLKAQDDLKAGIEIRRGGQRERNKKACGLGVRII